MPKYSKKDYADVLNLIFQTDIKWEKLSIKDLEIWYRIASDPENIGKRILMWEAKNRAQQRASEFVDLLGEALNQRLSGE